MNKKIQLVLITILLLVNTGCEKKEKKEVRETFKSIDYYKAHTEEMLARVKKCKNRNYIPSEAQRKDCKHAYAAYSYYWIRHR